MSSSFYGMPTGVLVNQYLWLEYLQGAGPRIVHLSLPGSAGAPDDDRGRNLMAEVPDVMIPTPYGPFKLYGGHRLWHSPEGMPRSYVPYSEGCAVKKTATGVLLGGCMENATGIRKSIEIKLAPDRPALTLTHTLQNDGVWPVELAPWAITQLRLGGIAFFPQTAGKLDGPGLLPNRNLVLWPYTRLADSRLRLNDDLHFIRADVDPHPVKIGYMNRLGWAGYLVDGILFVKRWAPQPDAPHADFGCNCESYCNHRFIEVETLGPLTRLEPGQSVMHVEQWELHRAEGVELTPDGIRQLVARLGLL